MTNLRGTCIRQIMQITFENNIFLPIADTTVVCSCRFGHDAFFADWYKWVGVFFLHRQTHFVTLLFSKALHSSWDNLKCCGSCAECYFPYWREVSRWCLGSLVIMEGNHDDDPVSITQVPSHPCRAVNVQDQRQQDKIGYSDDGAGQYDHKTYKHLPKHRFKRQVRISIRNKKISELAQTHTHLAKPSSDKLDSPKCWFKDWVKDNIWVCEGVKIKWLDQHSDVGQYFPDGQRQPAPSSPGARPYPHAAQQREHRDGTPAHPVARVLHTPWRK